MAKQKQYVFSARTTEQGLRQLNELKGKLNVSWDDLVIEAVASHYGLDGSIMVLPKKEKPEVANQEPVTGETQETPISEETGKLKTRKNARKATK